MKHVDDTYNQEFGVEDSYMGMQLGLPRGPDDELMHATVKRRAIDVESRPLDAANKNPKLDTRQYEVEFLYDQVEILTANLIAENIITQTHDEGHRHLMLDEIENHRVLKDAIPKYMGTYTTKQGTTRRKRTTRGWDLLVRWKDGTNSWVSLKDLKESYPIELIIQYIITYKTSQYFHDGSLLSRKNVLVSYPK